ncbi:MAG TPA: hypothetical protein VGD11_05540 [Mycobacteriales bacterium]
MHVTIRSGVRRFGGAALAVVTAAALVGLAGPAYADETAPVAPAPIGAESPAPAESPVPTQLPAPAPSDDPAPSEGPTPSDDPAPSGTPATPASLPTPVATRAAAATGDVAVTLRGTTVTTGAEYKFLQVIATNRGTEPAKDVVVDITIAPAAGPDRIELKATAEELDCVATGPDSMRCELGDLPAGTKVTVGVPYGPVAGATPNPNAGTVTATVSTSSADTDSVNDTAGGTLAIVAPASDVLVVADDILDAVPGKVAVTDVAVANFGPQPTGPAEITVAVPTGTTIVRDLPGCVTAADHRSLSCRYDSLSSAYVDPDNAVDFLEISVRVDASLVGPRTLTGGTAVVRDPAVRTVAAAGPVRTAALRQPGGAARLAALAGDADESDNNDTFVATVAPVANLVVTTGAVRVVGKTATVPFTVRNTGPAVATNVYVEITAPTGTAFARIPADCTRSGRVLRCDLADQLAAGSSVAGSVAFTVTGTSVGRNGSIVAGSDAVDPARADNTATIAVPVPAGSGPQGTLAQGRLPVTGPRSGPAAGTGAALLILGGALVLLARRRRPAAVSE